MILILIILISVHADGNQACVTLCNPSTLQRLSPVTIIHAGADPSTLMQVNSLDGHTPISISPQTGSFPRSAGFFALPPDVLLSPFELLLHRRYSLFEGEIINKKPAQYWRVFQASALKAVLSMHLPVAWSSIGVLIMKNIPYIILQVQDLLFI